MITIKFIFVSFNGVFIFSLWPPCTCPSGWLVIRNKIFLVTFDDVITVDISTLRLLYVGNTEFIVIYEIEWKLWLSRKQGSPYRYPRQLFPRLFDRNTTIGFLFVYPFEQIRRTTLKVIRSGHSESVIPAKVTMKGKLGVFSATWSEV